MSPTKRIKIPASIEAAEDRLAALDGIATAAGWERAALVYAFTYDASRGGGANRNAPNGALTISAFAGLGIKGLTKRDTVKHYRDCWKQAIDNDEAEAIEPGDLVVLPTTDFPPFDRGTDGYNTTEGAEKTINRIVEKHGPAVVAKTVANNPKVATAVVDDPEAQRATIRAQSKRTQQHVNQRRAAVAAAGANVKGEMAGATNAAPGSMSASVEYGRIVRAQGEMISTWNDTTKGGVITLSDFDIHLLLADQAALERHTTERRVVVEAMAQGLDPQEALAEHRKWAHEQFHRDMDEAEAETDLDAGLSEIERFANEGN
jgi:hypothetical protein